MKRLVLAVFGLIGLCACDPTIKSDAPLFTSSGAQPRPGLWAILEEGCAPPTMTTVEDWPPCAAPVWLRGDKLTLMMMNPARSRYVLTEGAPAVLQLSAPERTAAGGEPPEYSYVAFAPEGAPPYAGGRIWIETCPRPEPMAGVDESGGRCAARDAATVRRALARAASAGPGRRVVWVAP